MTAAGRLALALGLLTYLAAWAFGSKPLYPVALGLLAAVLLARIWTRVARRPVQLWRRIAAVDPVEGDDVPVELALECTGTFLPAPVVVREQIGKLGARETPIPFGGSASYTLKRLPRGRYVFEDSSAVVEDPLGFDRLEVKLSTPGAVLVYTRLVELERLFSESGAAAHDGRRLLLRRPAGFDLHSVRDYEQGESLRRVHWRSTAKRGQLMVKELEDSPRDEIAVVLDVDPSTVVGDSFDVQVRAAGSILRAHARRGRRAVLVVNSPRREQQRVQSAAGDWRTALDLLASVEPEAGPPLVALLAEEASAAARSLELTIVTASLTAPLAERLVERSLTHRHVSLVFVDAASFNGAESPRRPELLRLQAVGVAVAVLRKGDDLAAKLGAPAAAEAALA